LLYIHIATLIPTDIPKDDPKAKQAALDSFDKHYALMVNYVDPNLMNDVFLKQRVFLEDAPPISGLAKGCYDLRAQMDYMLSIIRGHIGAKNAEVFYNLIYSFQTVPEYNILARHLEGWL